MKANKVAKNILLDRTCDNCEHGYQMSRCTKDLYDLNVLDSKSENNTCVCWQRRVVLGNKLNVKWTVSAEKKMTAFHGVDVEEELIKTATNEIKRELKKKNGTQQRSKTITAKSKL